MTDDIKCRNCGFFFLKSVDVDDAGNHLLKSGTLLIQKVSGYCANCGEAFYWTFTDQQLKRLIDRMTKDRKKQSSKIENLCYNRINN